MKKTFQVFHEEYMGDDCKEIEAYDYEDAAEKYAEYYDSDGDYTVVGGSSIDVKVIGPDGISQELTVCGETVAHYSAREKRLPREKQSAYVTDTVQKD